MSWTFDGDPRQSPRPRTWIERVVSTDLGLVPLGMISARVEQADGRIIGTWSDGSGRISARVEIDESVTVPPEEARACLRAHRRWSHVDDALWARGVRPG